MKEVPLHIVQQFRTAQPDDVAELLDEYEIEGELRERYMLLAGKDLIQIRGHTEAEIDRLLTADIARLTYVDSTEVAAEVEEADDDSDEPPPLNKVRSYTIQAQHKSLFRSHWFATAFILGASYRMLGKLHGVTPQTIMQHVNKYLPPVKRNEDRLGYMLSPDKINEYHSMYYKNKLNLVRMEPQEAAQWLYDHTELDSETVEPAYQRDGAK